MSGRRRWWRVVIEWQLDSQDNGDRYAYVTKCSYEHVAISAAVVALADNGGGAVFAVGDTVRVLSCDPHAYRRGQTSDELEAIP